jgi:hypothetical protein
MSVYDKLKALGIVLAPVPPPAAAFLPFVRSGHLIFVSGNIAWKEGKPWTGKLGADLTTSEGKEAARDVAIQLMGALHEAAGDLNKIVRRLSPSSISSPMALPKSLLKCSESWDGMREARSASPKSHLAPASKLN